MKKNLYQLTCKIQEGNEDIEEMTKLFTPKIKKTLLQTSFHHKEELEQELYLKLIKIVKEYDLNGTIGFWEFQEKVNSQLNRS